MELDEQPNLETLIACSVKKLIPCGTLGVIRGEKRESFTKSKDESYGSTISCNVEQKQGT